jgi:hypothetical protein
VTSVARGNPARRRTLGLIVGACVVLLAASAGPSTSPTRAADEIVQQGTFRISIRSADDFSAAGTVTVIPAPPDPPFTCSDFCSFDYDEGQSLTLTANPNPGSFFHRWRQPPDQERKPNPCDASNFEATCTLRLTGAETDFAAIFLPDQTLLAVGVTGNTDDSGTPPAVSVSAGDDCVKGQSGGEGCYYAVAPGDTVTLSPKNTSAATLVNWSVPECPSTDKCTIAIDSQLRNVVATFSPINLTVIVEPNNLNGAVTGPGINCPPDCEDNFDAPPFAEVTLTASSSGFKGWNGACLEEGISQECTIRLSGDDVVGAWFLGSLLPPNIIPPRIPVALQVNKTGDGAGTVTSTRSRFRETINCGSGPGCDAFFEQGETARLVADPAAGSTFAGWKTPGNLCPSGVNCSFEVMRVSRLEANFVRRTQPGPPPPQPPPPPLPPPRHCTVRKDGGPRADRLNGGASSDAIHGRAGNDRIRGLGGNDCLFGEGGNDQAWGGPGNDAVSGGKGSDRLYGGPGRDTMQGGPGRDRIFAVDRARDVVVCGRGRDTVRADRVDKILGCELVRRR